MFFLQLVILGAVIFAGMVAVLKWLMGQHAMTATAHLQGLSQDYIKRQDDLKQRLEDAEHQYQEQVLKAQEEAQQLKTQAAREAETSRLQVVEQAHQEAEKIVQQAIQTREALIQELTRSMDGKAVERACELIKSLLPEEFRAAVHAAWFDALVRNGLFNAEQLPMTEPVEQAQVASAFALTEAQRKLLGDRLKAVLGRAVALQETVEPRLVAGVTITLGHLVLDGSLGSKLNDAVRDAQHTGD